MANRILGANAMEMEILNQLAEIRERLARLEPKLDNGYSTRFKVIQWAVGLLFSLNIALLGLAIKIFSSLH